MFAIHTDVGFQSPILTPHPTRLDSSIFLCTSYHTLNLSSSSSSYTTSHNVPCSNLGGKQHPTIY